MALLKDVSKFISNFTSEKVYGTFDVKFDPAEFEREREDGASIIDLCPDCRVFIAGAELTRDINSVNVTHSMDGSRCEITLNNPRGKYEISKMDLMKKWREDKDILAAYEYDTLKKIDPLNYDKVAQSIGGLIGNVAGGAAQAGQFVDMTKQAVDTIGGLVTNIPEVRGVTRMLFETKFYSGIIRKAGDIVFDYRDPVMVFMKGRFSPYWYFVFTGIISSYSDTDAYGESNVLTLKCEDVTALWKRTKMSEKGSFFGMSNLENRIFNTNVKTSGIPTNLAAQFTFSQLVKIVAFSYDYGIKARHCFPQPQSPTDLIDLYDDIIEDRRQSFGIDKKFKVTDNGFFSNIGTRFIGNPLGVRDMKKIKSSLIDDYTYTDGPNDKPFSAAAAIYLQWNEINIPEKKFDGTTISKMFDLSVRLWEVQHDIVSKGTLLGGDYIGTGWKNNKYIGISGIHPAMKYNFIDNFNMLERIWSLHYKHDTAFTVIRPLDNLKMSLYDKIYETVIGSPTEFVPSGKKMNDDIPAGTNINYFRPRLFVLLPYKYSGLRKMSGDFEDLGKLEQDQVSTIWEYLKTTLKSVEYNFYCSPCGDIFVEPELYDMHPLEFCGQIEPRSIVEKEDSGYISNWASSMDFSQEKKEDARYKPETEKQKVKVEYPAYFFNPKANHPYFIMEKDRIRITHEFSADKIVSAVFVQGGFTNNGGVLEGAFKDMKDFSRLVANLAKGGGLQLTDSMNFAEGIYVADGFEQIMQTTAMKEEFIRSTEIYVKRLEEYKKKVFINLITESYDIDVKTMITNFLNSIQKIQPPGGSWWKGIASSVNKDLEWRPEVAEDIKKMLSLEPEDKRGPTYTDDLIYKVTNKYCTNIKQSAKIEESVPIDSVLNELILNKKIRDFLVITLDPRSARKKEDETWNDILQNLRRKSATPSEPSESKISDEEKYQLLQKFTDSGLFDLDGSGSPSDIIGGKRGIVNDFMTLYEPKAIIDYSDIKDLYSKIVEYRKSQYFPRQLRAVTINDLKKLEKQGKYDPRKDLCRLYGFKRIDPVSNQFVKNGEEATTYAKSIFNRLLGEAYSVNVTFIGRPEMWLNRPYFVERKDCIGMSRNYSINYRYNGDFESTVLLTYIRKNALTYAYSLGNLDVPRQPYGNDYFYSQGRLYLQLQETLNKTNKLIGQTTGSLISSGIGGTAGAITGEITGGLVTDALDVVKLGGLYVMHDVLGHMDYDSRGNSNNAELDETTGGDKAPYYPFYGQGILKEVADSITAVLDGRKKAQDEIDKKLKNEKQQKETDISTKEEEINTLSRKSPKTSSDNFDLMSKKKKLEKCKSELESISNKIVSYEAIITAAEDALFGSAIKIDYPGAVKNDSKLNIAIKKLWEIFNGSIKKDQGLLYYLFSLHVGYLDRKADYNTLEITTDNGKASNAFPDVSTKYYIIDKKSKEAAISSGTQGGVSGGGLGEGIQSTSIGKMSGGAVG
ncbi:MAG TPA: hypothetical protein P5136_02300 [Methanofastidiosum sp.]|nr:hypothetical protein [Methanofastidiosum sp.]